MTTVNDIAMPSIGQAVSTKIIHRKEKGQNRHWKNFLDKDYLGSHNLEKGEEMLLTIQKFEGEEMVKSKDGAATPKPVLYFVENVPKMIMNITNGNTISALYGTHPDQWIGKQIQVYAASVKAFGKVQDALRIRDFVPAIKVDVPRYTKALLEAKTLVDLKTIWAKFPTSARNDKSLIAKKDELKNFLK
jgi:hypothetical protein